MRISDWSSDVCSSDLKRPSDLVGQGLQAFLYQTRDFALTRGWHAFGDSRYADSQIGVAFCVAQRAAHAQRAAYRIVAYNRIASGSRILNQLPHFTGAHAAVLLYLGSVVGNDVFASVIVSFGQ